MGNGSTHSVGVSSSVSPSQTQGRASGSLATLSGQQETNKTPCLHIWSVFCSATEEGPPTAMAPSVLARPPSSHSRLGVDRDSRRTEVEEEGQREEGRNDAVEQLSADPAAGRGPEPDPRHRNMSYRQPKSVLLLLHRLQGGQPVEVLLHVRLLHLVIGRDQDLRRRRDVALSHRREWPAPPAGLEPPASLEEAGQGRPLYRMTQGGPLQTLLMGS